MTIGATRDDAAAAWRAVVAPIPGVNDPETVARRRSRPGSRWLVGGGCGFWLLAGAFVIAWWFLKYGMIGLYVGAVLAIRLVTALLVTLGWGLRGASSVGRRRP